MQSKDRVPQAWHGKADDFPCHLIGNAVQITGVPAETIRIWERRGMIRPNRAGYHRKFSNTDILRLHFIRRLLERDATDLAEISRIVARYPCWHIRSCNGKGGRNSSVPVAGAKPCWKNENTFCLPVPEKAETCFTCDRYSQCSRCTGCLG